MKSFRYHPLKLVRVLDYLLFNSPAPYDIVMKESWRDDKNQVTMKDIKHFIKYGYIEMVVPDECGHPHSQNKDIRITIKGKRHIINRFTIAELWEDHSAFARLGL